MKSVVEVNLLTNRQIAGEKALAVMNLYGRQTALTDLSVILGGIVNIETTVEGDKAGYVWSASRDKLTPNVVMVTICGEMQAVCAHVRVAAVRPVLPVLVAETISPSMVKTLKLLNGKKVQTCEFGEYPQMVVSDKVAQKLEELYFQKALKETGNKYTFDSVGLKDYSTPFKPCESSEYEMDECRYIRIEGKEVDRDLFLSNGQMVEGGQSYFVKVEPIEWLMDETGIWVSKKALFAGVQFDPQEEYNGDFSQTNMKSFMDKYFVPEMMQSVLGQDGKDKMIAQLKEMSIDEIVALPQKDPNVLKNLVLVGGFLEEAIEALQYKQQKALYSKIYKNLSPTIKKNIEQAILNGRDNKR